MRRSNDTYSRGWLTFYVVNDVIASCLVFHAYGSGWSMPYAGLVALWTWLALREIERMPKHTFVTAFDAARSERREG